MLSPLEFEWDLPHESSLWEAPSAAHWRAALHDEPFEDEFSQTRSMLAATQALMSNCASKALLRALQSCPFAALCVITSICSLSRDFTRCYYQLPPRLSDPSPFHVLSQTQNGQFASAIATISAFKENTSCDADGKDCQSLWHAVQLACVSIRIGLCKPDDLLVGGITESTPAAGLATSVHLTLGNFVSTRRAGSTSKRPHVGDDGMMVIMDDMLSAVHLLGAGKTSQQWEGPWTTVQGLRVLIFLWQSLRFSIAELQSQVCEPPPRKVYDPASIAVHSIISALDLYEPDVKHITHASLSTEEGLEKVDQLEAQFVHWMQRVCDRRDVWDIGRSMSKVLDEIQTMNLGTPSNASPI